MLGNAPAREDLKILFGTCSLETAREGRQVLE
jgi:hypothetical protein